MKAFIPDIQPDEVGTRENVIFAEHHPDVRHQDVLQKPRGNGGANGEAVGSKLTMNALQ